MCKRGNCFSFAGTLPKDLRTAPGARRIIIKINKKDPTRATIIGITKDFPESSTEREKPQPPHTITNSTVKIDMRARGRQGRVRVSCNAANTSWRWGSVRLAMQPDGRR